MVKRTAAWWQADPRRLLIPAACLHLAVTTMIFAAGRLSLMPGQFNQSGIGQFAADGNLHLADSAQLTGKLETQGIGPWLTGIAPLHTRIYSLSLLVLHRVIGFNILSIEPVNLLLYLLTLIMVFQLTEKIFDRQAAITAAILVAVWPTLLIHSTQPLRDPLLIAAVLAFLLILHRWLTERLGWRRGILLGVSGVFILLMIWIVRLAMWDVARFFIGFGIVLLIVRQIRQKSFMPVNVIVALLFLSSVLVIPRCNRQLQFLEKREADVDLLLGEAAAPLPLWERIIARREGFIDLTNLEDYHAGSDIDINVRFHNRAEIMRYVPRAVAIGLFAPFPNTWFSPGLLVGRTGRLISGVETAVTYGLEVLAIFGLWRARRDPFAWLAAAAAILGTTALGMVVTNIGSIYRLRYPYWILIVMLGAGGAAYLIALIKNRQESSRDSIR